MSSADEVCDFLPPCPHMYHHMAELNSNRDKKKQKRKKPWPLDNRKSIKLIAELSIKPKKRR